MTDNEWNRQANQTARSIEDHHDQVEDTRRNLVNNYAQKKGVIEDTEDFMNEYRNQGYKQMQAVEDYLTGNKKDWEEAQKAIDAIAKEEGFWTTRRAVVASILGGGAATGLGAIGGIASNLGGPKVEYSVASGEQFEEFYNSLRENQKKSLELIYGDEEELFGDQGRDLVAFEARNDGDPSTEPKYKLWTQFSDGSIDDYNWQEWNLEDYEQFADQYGRNSKEERMGDNGYVNRILEGEFGE